MIDLIPLKDFLASIAPVSRTNYQIRGRNGEMVFSAGGVMPEKLSVEEFQHLTSKVIEQKAFRYTSRDGCDFLCGIPIRNGQGVFGALLAFGRIPDRSTLYDAGQDAKASHTREMENFLGHLISLLEDNFNAKEEIAEMAEVLTQSFDDLELYSRIGTEIKTSRFSDGVLKDLIKELLKTRGADFAFARFSDLQEFNVRISKKDLPSWIPDVNAFVDRLLSLIPPNARSLGDDYFVVNDSRTSPGYTDLVSGPYRFLGARVRYKDKIYGWLGLVSFDLSKYFRRGELKLLASMADQTAVVIANTKLYQDLEHLITTADTSRSNLKISGNDFDNEIEVKSRDEVQVLAEVFKEINRKVKEGQALLRKTAKMGAIGQMASGFIHEINQPLAAIYSLIQLSLMGEPPAMGRDNLESMMKAIERLIGIVARFKTFSGYSEIKEMVPVSITQVIHEVQSLISHQFRMGGIRFDVEKTGHISTIMGDANSLQQLFLNLIINAADAFKDYKKDQPLIKVLIYSAGNSVCVEIADNGPGIPKEIQNQIFNPFFTTKLADKGTGLGLAISSEIIGLHDGEIKVQSELGKGTCFTVKIPKQ